MNFEFLWWIRHLHICFSFNPHNPDEVGETSTPSSGKLWAELEPEVRPLASCWFWDAFTEFTHLIHHFKNLTDACGISIVCRVTDPMLNGPKERKFCCFLSFLSSCLFPCYTSIFQSRLGEDQRETLLFLQKCLNLEFHISNFLLLLWGSRFVLKQKEAAGNLVSILEGYQCKGSQINLTVDTPALKEPEECLQWASGHKLWTIHILLWIFRGPELRENQHGCWRPRKKQCRTVVYMRLFINQRGVRITLVSS